MKKGILAGALIALTMSLNAFAEANKEKRDIDEFSKIEASKGVNVSLIQNNEKREIEVVTEGCPTADVETTIKKDVLYVKMKKRTAGSAVQVFVYFKDIDEVKLKGGASVDTECLFAHEGKFTLDLAADCEAEMDVEVDELEVLGNTCMITMSGKAKKQTVDIAGTLGNSKYDAEALESDECDIIATTAEAVVNVKDKLNAQSAGGIIRYKGTAEVTKKETFEGKIVELE
ncbi:MAG: DUF2807 domain-containing protein [Bacteroidales bacterium]|nr:DUF2807 domain-containing protein [Bacteroidales bacterium]